MNEFRNIPLRLEESFIDLVQKSPEVRLQFAALADIMFGEGGYTPSNRVIETLIGDDSLYVLKEMTTCQSLTERQCKILHESILKASGGDEWDFMQSILLPNALESLATHNNASKKMRDEIINMLEEGRRVDKMFLYAGLVAASSDADYIQSIVKKFGNSDGAANLVLSSAANNSNSSVDTLVLIAGLIKEGSLLAGSIIEALANNPSTPTSVWETLAEKHQDDLYIGYIARLLVAREWIYNLVSESIIPKGLLREGVVSSGGSLVDEIESLITELVRVDSFRTSVASQVPVTAGIPPTGGLPVSAFLIAELLGQRKWEGAQALAANWVETLKGVMPAEMFSLFRSCKDRISGSKTIPEWDDAVLKNRMEVDNSPIFEELGHNDVVFLNIGSAELARESILAMSIVFASTKASNSFTKGALSRHGTAHLGLEFYSPGNAVAMSWLFYSLLITVLCYMEHLPDVNNNDRRGGDGS